MPYENGGGLLPPSAMDAVVESIRNTTLTTKRLSSLLMAHNRWAFGTVMRPRDARSTERVMVVGNRQVTTLTSRRGRVLGVENTVNDWFDFWEVDPTA